MDGTAKYFRTGTKTIDDIADRIGATELRPIFTVGGKFEQRQREAGLHLWYEVVFDESVPVTRAVPRFSDIDGIELVEPSIIIKAPETKYIPAGAMAARTLSSTTNYPFDDPLGGAQWNFHNDGTSPYSLEGADIDLFDAWEIETGKPNVIVAVIDSGVDGDHPDLNQNMWTDEFGNYGLNVSTPSIPVEPAPHGTHIAGVIAAVNNNGIGVSGIAGGDGTPNSGVRIMSCQIFDTSELVMSQNIGDAFVYAADNGAIIASCSWYVNENSFRMQSTIAGIEYFTTYAGVDENGRQTGPMRGGLVICAAGNDFSNVGFFPASMESNSVISVAAIGPDYQKASYSNWHTTVDITAPGGDVDKNAYQNGILSTVPVSTEPTGYAWWAGTSMATPHVSGIAALVLSKYGGQGLTPATVKDALIKSCSGQILYFYNPDYVGELGAGLINAGTVMGLGDNAVSITGPQETFKNRTEIYRLTYDNVGIIASVLWSVDGNAQLSVSSFNQVSLNFTDSGVAKLTATIQTTMGTTVKEEFLIACRDTLFDDDIPIIVKKSPPYSGVMWHVGETGTFTIDRIDKIDPNILVGIELTGDGTTLVQTLAPGKIEFLVESCYEKAVMGGKQYFASIGCVISYRTAAGSIRQIEKIIELPVENNVPYLKLSADQLHIDQYYTVTLDGVTSTATYDWIVTEAPYASPPPYTLAVIPGGSSNVRNFKATMPAWYTLSVPTELQARP